MANKREPIYNVIQNPEEESEFFSGKPNKMAYLMNSCKEYFPRFCFDVVFKILFIPFVYFKICNEFTPIANLIIIILWALYLIPTFALLRIPFQKLKEYKHTFYLVTNKAIYIQFGIDQLYYRVYPNERIGTHVFYRPSKIDNLFGVGTLGFSVDDYYEERINSIEDYESLYNVLKEITNSRKEELIKLQEEREAKKREFEEQAKLIAQEEMFRLQAEEEEEKKRRERYEREMQEHFERERLEHDRYIREREEKKRLEQENRARRIEEEDENPDKFSDFRNKQRKINEENESEDDGDDEFTDAYDMFGGTEIEERPPSEKTINSYRSRMTPSLKAHRRPSGKRQSVKSIKSDPNTPVEETGTNNSLDMNKLWT